MKIGAHSLVVSQDRFSTALIFPPSHFGTTLVRVGTLCMLAGDFIGARGAPALAQAPDDGWLRNAGRPTQEHASVDNPLVILLVEDEVLVRMVAADVLEDAGFTVLESTNAEEALRLLETRPDVQVLFTDVNMPGALDGLGLAQTVHNRSPEVGILIGSGRIRPDPGELPPCTRFIAKPYAPAALTDAVRAVARGQQGRGELSMTSG